MSIKVVRGSSGSSQSLADAQKQLDQQATRAQTAKAGQSPAGIQSQISTLTNALGTVARSADAVVTTLRTVAKGSLSRDDKIKNFDDAKQVAEKVADGIRRDEVEGLGAQSNLSSSSAKDHLD